MAIFSSSFLRHNHHQQLLNLQRFGGRTSTILLLGTHGQHLTILARQLGMRHSRSSLSCSRETQQARGEGPFSPQAEPQFSGGNVTEEAAVWANEDVHDPMVELDPVTVLHRKASDQSNITQEDEALVTQTTPSSPLVSNGKNANTIAIAFVCASIVIMVTALLQLRKSAPTEATGSNNGTTISTNTLGLLGGRKVIKEGTIVSQSVLTAMKLGAASVGRSKSVNEITHGNTGMLVIEETQFMGQVISTNQAADEEMIANKFFEQKTSFVNDKEDGSSLDHDERMGEMDEGPCFSQELSEDSEVVRASSSDNDVSEQLLIGEMDLEDNADNGQDKEANAMVNEQSRNGTPMNILCDVIDSRENLTLEKPIVETQESSSLDPVLGIKADDMNFSNNQGLDDDLEEDSSKGDKDVFPVVFMPSNTNSAMPSTDSSPQNVENLLLPPAPHTELLLPSPSSTTGSLEEAHTMVVNIEETETYKTLKEAVPLAVGVGTVLSVTGGLQVVGLAALTSFLSRELLWADSRDMLWQELRGITNRQKLVEFLARRKIVSMGN